MNLQVLEKPSALKSWLFSLAFKNVRLRLYVFSLGKTFDVCKSKKFQITRDAWLLASICNSRSSSVFCLATNGTLGHFSDHLFCVIFFFLLYVLQQFLKLSDRKNIKVLEKDFQRLYLRSFNPPHVTHANTYLHTLCSKNKNTFYTSKDRLNNNYNFLA